MVNSRGLLYFSPRYTFLQLFTLTPEQTVDAYEDRIRGYYFEPVRDLVRDKKEKNAFLAGIGCFAAIDAIAKTVMPSESSSKRFKEWITKNLDSFKNLRWKKVERVYDDFRSGTVHEARVKCGGQYTFDINDPIRISDGIMQINPGKLLDQLEGAFESYMKELRENPRMVREFRKNVEKDFKDDIDFARLQ